jgi:hypothetical protein
MRQGEKSLKLELARRHAASPEAAELVPSPPGPQVDWPFTLSILAPMVAAVIAVPLLTVSAFRRLGRATPAAA